MPETYQRDEYSCEEYSDKSINVSCVCSWSIHDVTQHRPVVTVFVADVHFNSDSQKISDEKLYSLADRLQQAETGNAMAHLTRERRVLRASLRDYDQESQRFLCHPLTRRIGESWNGRKRRTNPSIIW
jgi:hypothetical protein